ELAEVVPDARLRGHHVRLAAAVRDHVMRALLQAQVLAPVVPGDVHELDRVQGTPTGPWGAGTVRRAAAERELRGHQPRTAHAPAGAHVIADVCGEHRVHVPEEAGVHHVDA